MWLSQTFTVLSSPAEATHRPSGSGLKATVQTSPLCPRRVFSSWPVCTSQILTVFSFASRHQAPAVRAERHGQTHAAVLRAEGVAGFLAFSSRRVASHSFTTPSPLAEARCRPSRLNTTPRTHLPVVGAERADRFAGPRVPDLHGSVRFPRDQVSAVGAERHGEVLLRPARERRRLVRPVCASQTLTVNSSPSWPAEAIRWPSGCQATQKTIPVWPLNSTLTCSGPRVPDLGGRQPQPAEAIFWPSGLTATLQTSSPCCVKVRVSCPSSTLERGRVPDADGPVLAGRGKAPAVRAERHAPAHAGVSAQAEHLPAGRRVPDVHDLVFAGRGEAPAVRAEGDAQNESAMRKRAEQLAGRRIPHVHAAAEAGRGQPPAVRAERQRGDGREIRGRCTAARPLPPGPKASRFPAHSRTPGAARRD